VRSRGFCSVDAVAVVAIQPTGAGAFELRLLQVMALAVTPAATLFPTDGSRRLLVGGMPAASQPDGIGTAGAVPQLQLVSW
jgi:hypothetical protein